ncbi:hypothetical protein Taro_049496 [Colocasia esculenta]|uniref:Uncharacterized protein n=1 Tax=Colocasia esculenta TaxID=4460 RepID=A0A843XB25_COLES|nr:hypothetical protein [Colocasia esculenta]
MTSGRSSSPRHRKVLYFPHRRLWIMEYSCKVWCKPCRRRLTLRRHSRHSWRLRAKILGTSYPNHLGAVSNGLKALLSDLPSSGHLQRLGDSWSIREGFPDLALVSTSVKNPEEGVFEGFLGLPKERFTAILDSFGVFFRGKQELGVNAFDAEIPGIVGDDTLAEEAVETDSERAEQIATGGYTEGDRAVLLRRPERDGCPVVLRTQQEGRRDGLEKATCRAVAFSGPWPGQAEFLYGCVDRSLGICRQTAAALIWKANGCAIWGSFGGTLPFKLPSNFFKRQPRSFLLLHHPNHPPFLPNTPPFLLWMGNPTPLPLLLVLFSASLLPPFVPLIHPCPIISMAPKAKKLVSLRRPASSRARDDDRAPVERQTKLRDDRLPELVVPPRLHLTHSKRSFSKFVQPSYTEGNDFYTTVKGTTFQLTTNLLSKALQIPNSGADILTHTPDASVYYPLITLQPYDGTKKAAKLNANFFPPLNRMIHHIFTTLIAPKHGSQELVTDVHKSLFTFFLWCEPINLPVLMLGLILQCFYQPRRSMPFACPLTSLMRFIGIDIPDSECITLNSRNSFVLTVAHRMGYKLIDGVVTRELKGKAPAVAMDVNREVDAADANAANDDEEADDEDSQSEPLDAPGDNASNADVEPSLRDLLAQMQLQMSTGFDKLHARLDTVETSLEALTVTQVQLQLQLTRLQIELQDTRQAPAPPADDVA